MYSDILPVTKSKNWKRSARKTNSVAKDEINLKWLK